MRRHPRRCRLTEVRSRLRRQVRVHARQGWKSAGTCTGDLKKGDKIYDTWEEGSHLKEYTYKYTGGTGTFEGASGGGTYMYESLTDTLTGGTYKGQLVLP